MTKKIISVGIFLVLLAISVFAGAWYYNKYMRKKDTVALPPAPVDVLNPNNNFDDVSSPDTGKKAYSKYGNATTSTLNLVTVKTFAKDELIGTITGEKILGDTNTADYFYVIDEIYLVSKALVTVQA